MSLKAQVTGTFALVDESTGTNVISFNLADVFKVITGINEQTYVERQIVDTDGVVALDLGGVGTVKGMLIYVVGGSGVVTVKHDSNTNGIDLNNGQIIFGELASVTIETTSTQALTVKYVFFE